MPHMFKAPKDVYIRPSAEVPGGMEVCVRTADGGFEVLDLSPERAASWLKLLAGYVEARFREKMGIAR